MSPITTHVLDTALGRPAAGVSVILGRVEAGSVVELARGSTNQDGRIADWWPSGKIELGVYQVRFETAAYFEAVGCSTFFYPEVSIRFEVKNIESHYHIPLLLSPFGYSTYRGS